MRRSKNSTVLVSVKPLAYRKYLKSMHFMSFWVWGGWDVGSVEVSPTCLDGQTSLCLRTQCKNLPTFHGLLLCVRPCTKHEVYFVYLYSFTHFFIPPIFFEHLPGCWHWENGCEQSRCLPCLLELPSRGTSNKTWQHKHT